MYDLFGYDNIWISLIKAHVLWWCDNKSDLIWFDIWPRYNYLKMWKWVQKKSKYWKIIFKVVQMKFLAMHITNQKLSLDIFMVRNLLNIFMEHDLYLMS